jgi:hypothetical protein
MKEAIGHETIKEWVFLVWNTAALYNGHPSGNDVWDILNRIGTSYGFNVEDASRTNLPETHCDKSESPCRRNDSFSPHLKAVVSPLIESIAIDLWSPPRFNAWPCPIHWPGNA